MSYEIERLGHLGDGIAQGPVYADRVLPGEVVNGDLIGDRLENIRIVTPSDNRIASRCQAYKRCGGCSLHHASDGFVANWKKSVVENALGAQGISIHVGAIHTSAPNTRRRAKLSATRTKKRAIVGLMGRASDIVQPIDGCQILHPKIMQLIPALQQFTAQFGSRKAKLVFWVLQTDGGMDVAVDGLPDFEDQALGDLAAWTATHGIARLSLGDDVICKLAEPVLNFGSVKVTPPPKAFAQATPAGQIALQDAVRRAVGSAAKVADLFAGCGTLGLPLADHATLHAVEGDAGLLGALEHGVRHAQGIKRVTCEQRDLFRIPLDHSDLDKFDAAVVDPPRAGAEAQVQQLAQSSVKNIAMVSCNPVTFARDAKLLIEGGYRLNWIEVVDQFRWSPHIEIASHFTKA